MALVPHKIVALNELNEGAKNTISGAVVSLFDTEGNAVTLFDDESGGNGSTAKQTDSEGVVVVYVTPGEYDEQVNGGIQRRVLVGNKEITTEQLIERIRKSRDGDVITTTGFSVAGDAGGAQWKATATTGLTPSQTPVDRDAAELVDSSGRLWELVSALPTASREINPLSLGLKVGAGNDNKAILQLIALIVESSAAPITICFPTGDIYTSASSEYVMSIEDASNFTLKGNQTSLIINSGDVGSPLRVQRSTDWTIEGLKIKCNQTVASGFHGVAITDCQMFTFTKCEVYDSAGYGIGLQGDATASYEKCELSHLKVIRAGSDGIDFKNNEQNNVAITLSHIYVEDPSWLNPLKPGIDIRGPATISDVHILFTGANTTYDAIGLRTRQTGSGLIGSRGAALSDIVVVDRSTGMNNVGFALVEFDTVQSNLTANGCKSSGFQIANDAVNLQLVNCVAIDCGTGYFNSGENTKLISCTAVGSETEGFRSSSTTSSTYIACESLGAGTFGFRAAAATNMEMAYCKSKGSGTSNYSIGATGVRWRCKDEETLISSGMGLTQAIDVSSTPNLTIENGLITAAS